MASVTISLTGYIESFSQVFWFVSESIGSAFADDGMEQTLTNVGLNNGPPLGQVTINLSGTNNRFTTEFEDSGRFIFIASDDETLEIVGGVGDDMTEPYSWTPTNSAEVIAFANHVRALSDQNATLTLTDDPPTVAPSFSDDTGDSQSWTVGTAITPITVPEADGDPTPTYAVQGSAPAGIAFNTTTRVISGTPTVAGTGIITIRASNSEGNADWTVAYTTAAPAPRAPAIPAAPTLTILGPTSIQAVGVAPDPGTEPIDSYDWRYKPTAGSLWTDRLNQTNLTQEFTGLVDGTEYEVQFRATNSVGDSLYSTSATTTPQTVSQVPSRLTLAPRMS